MKKTASSKAATPSLPRRCYLFPKTLTDSLTHSTAAALKKRGFHQANLLAHWPDIVGHELARFCTPVKLSPPPEGALYVKVCSGSHALNVQYAEPLILERLARFCGHSAARRIVILQ